MLLEEVARMTPVVICFDDVHWADPSTTDLLAYLARRIDNTRLLIIATARPSELAQTKHAFLPMKLDLLSRGMCREIVPSSLRVEDWPISGASFSRARISGGVRLGPARAHRRQSSVHVRPRPRPAAPLVIVQIDGRWRLAADLSSVERELPQSVRSAVQRKLEALDDRGPKAAQRGQRPGSRLRHGARRVGAASCAKTTSRTGWNGSSASRRSSSSSTSGKHRIAR